MMRTFNTVEEYMEFIGGHIDANGKRITGNTLWSPSATPPISLARYDVGVVSNLSTQELGYTDRQAELACRLILKYRRQLEKLGVDPTPVEKPVFRNPIREIDRACTLAIQDDKLRLRFPYQQELISCIREYGKESAGNVHFNRKEKVWELALTEPNLVFAYEFARQHEFKIADNIEHLMSRVLDVEQTPFSIELQPDLTIQNANAALLNFLERTIEPDLVHLADASAVGGYVLNPAVRDQILQQYGGVFLTLCEKFEINFGTGPDMFAAIPDIINWAKAVGRSPVYIYQPDLSNTIVDEFSKYYEPDEVLCVRGKIFPDEIPAQVKVIAMQKIPQRLPERVPVLVSNAGMFYGGDRRLFLQHAEKVVYFTTDVYNSKNQKA